MSKTDLYKGEPMEEFKCPVCGEYISENEVLYNYVTEEDGLFKTSDEKDVWYGMGYIMSDLILIDNTVVDNDYFESYVNGVCSECAKDCNTVIEKGLFDE